MDPEIETKHSTDVEMAVQCIYRTIFPQGDQTFVSNAFGWTLECFRGAYRNFGPIDAKYHDLEHTLQGTLCFCRMLHGKHVSGEEPRLTQRMFELGLLAILLHDTGYLKERKDSEGTGAKYTMIHVSRSIDFAGMLLAEKGIAPEEIKAVQNMIRCTGVSADLKAIPFGSELERIVGFCLGTADLLGQMAARDYVDKLPILYSEFEESAQHNSGRGSATGVFGTVRDLMEKTPSFWKHYVLPKIDNDFTGVYRFLNSPYPDGPNVYLRRIETNMLRLKAKLAAD